MAGSYILPQTRVFQEFAQTPNDVTQDLNPFVIGPNFQLIRYANEDERDDCAHGDYDGSSLPLGWADGADKTVVDKAWYKVTFVDAYVKLGDPLTPECLDDPSNSGRGTKFEFTLTGDKTLAGTSDPSKLYCGVAVKPGDYLAYTEGGKRKYTKIREVSIGTAREDETSVTLRRRGSSASVLGTVFTVDPVGYKGEKPVTVNLEVTDNKTKLAWSSDNALIKSDEKRAIGTDPIDLGLGLKVTKADGIADGKYTLTVTINAAHIRDTVTVADIIPTGTAVTFVRHFDSIAAEDTDLTASSDGVTVDAGASVDIGGSKLYEVDTAVAYLDQRNLRTDHIDSVYSVRSDSDIVTALGAYDTPDNPLAYALHIMLLNNANRAIKFIGVKSDDAAGYTEALKRASVTSEVYAFCPLTEDRAIIESVVADCNRLSAPEEKSWRIAIFSEPTPESVDVVSSEDGSTCTISATGLLSCAGEDFTETVRAGDTVYVLVAAEWLEREVVSVKSNTELQLDEKAGVTATPYRFRVTHVLAPGEYVSAIAETSARYRDRRAYNVFPNSLRASDGHVVSGVFAAAAVTALTCSVSPQQPITNVEIKGFSDLPDVYSKFSRDELNEIAAGGTLILMQDRPGGTVYVRHQISTAYRDGNLNTTELSLVKNIDSISYYFANRTAPYIGRYNITDDLIAEIRGVLEDSITHLETTTESSKLVGPQLLAEGTEIRSLYRSAEKDKLYANVALNLPAPFNNFDLHLQVI